MKIYAKDIKISLLGASLLGVKQKQHTHFLCDMTKHDNYTQKKLENLGNRLKAIRKKAGYTSAEKFAYKNDINRAQYGKYEVGADLRFSSLVKILNALDISLAEFFSEGFE